jgi:hypothetical protein
MWEIHEWIDKKTGISLAMAVSKPEADDANITLFMDECVEELIRCINVGKVV